MNGIFRLVCDPMPKRYRIESIIDMEKEMQITSITKPKATFENTSDLSATLVSRILPEKMPSGLVVDDIEIDAKALAVINKSPDRVDLAFEVEGSDIGKVTRDAIAKELQLNGPFRSLNEVERRVDGFGPGKLEVTRKVAEIRCADTDARRCSGSTTISVRDLGASCGGCWRDTGSD